MRGLALCLCLTALFLVPARCAEGSDGLSAMEDVLQAQSEALDLEGLEEAAGEYGTEILLLEDGGLEQGLQSVLDTGSAELGGVLRKGVRSAVLLLAVVLLCGLAEGFSDGLGIKGVLDPTAVVGALAVAAIAVGDVNTLVGLGRSALEEMDGFSKVLLPATAAAVAASGAPTQAAARQVATVLFSDVLLTLMDRLLLPILYGYLAASMAWAAVGNEGLRRLAELLRRLCTWLLNILLMAFVTYLTVSGVIAGNTDALALKAAKLTISGMVPVVGGILSDAAGTVLAGAGILKNAIGIFGMTVILSMCVLPFLQLGIHYLLYKLTAALTATVSDGRTAGLIDSIGGAFGLVLGMTGAGALLLLVSLVSAVAVTVGG